MKDEKIISALICCNTYTEAAKKAGCSVKTIYNKLQEFPFCAALSAARADARREMFARLAGAQSQALECLLDILTDAEATNGDKIKAASLLLEKGAAAAAALQWDEAETADKLRNADRAEAERNGALIFP